MLKIGKMRRGIIVSKVKNQIKRLIYRESQFQLSIRFNIFKIF